MDPLSQLSTECLQHILHKIQDWNSPSTVRTFLSLLRVNRYIATVTIPFPFHNDNPWPNKRTSPFKDSLLSSTPVINLPKILSLDLDLDLDPTSTTKLDPSQLNYLQHLRHVNLRTSTFRQYTGTTMMRKEYSDKELEFIQGQEFESICQLDGLLPPPFRNDRRSYNKDTFLRLCHPIVLYHETIWTLAAPIFEQLESLTISLSDIHRYHEVIHRLGRLELIKPLLDTILDYLTYGAQAEKSKRLLKEERMRLMVLFVEHHARLFKGRLKTVSTSDSGLWTMGFQTCPKETVLEINRTLPPLQWPESLSLENWLHVFAHPLSTDLCHVHRIRYLDLTVDCQQILQRCRSLKELSVQSLGRGNFDWAVQEKKDIERPGQVSVNSQGSGGKELLQDSSRPARLTHSLVPLSRVSLQECTFPCLDLDAVVFVFSQTLQSLSIGSLRRADQVSTIHVGREWVDLPALTCLDLYAPRSGLSMDSVLLARCTNLTHVKVVDETAE